RDTPLKRTLFACDELAGFVSACGFVRPDGIATLEPKSVRKKLKQPSFASGVHREDVYEGADLLGIDLDEHIANVIEALRPLAAARTQRGQVARLGHGTAQPGICAALAAWETGGWANTYVADLEQEWRASITVDQDAMDAARNRVADVAPELRTLGLSRDQIT